MWLKSGSGMSVISTTVQAFSPGRGGSAGWVVVVTGAPPVPEPPPVPTSPTPVKHAVASRAARVSAAPAAIARAGTSVALGEDDAALALVAADDARAVLVQRGLPRRALGARGGDAADGHLERVLDGRLALGVAAPVRESEAAVDLFLVRRGE